MKHLILKGLGKAKVKRILKLFIIDSFNSYLEISKNPDKRYDFSVPLYVTIYNENGGTYGLPDIEDDPFTVGELADFVGGKI